MKTINAIPILIETDSYSDLIICAADKSLHLTEHYGSPIKSNLSEDKYQKLILVSLENKIEAGDKYLDDCGIIREAVTSDVDYWRIRKDYKKIIACSDTSLNHSDTISKPYPTVYLISQEYIKTFIHQYNSNSIDDVQIEMEGRWSTYIEHTLDPIIDSTVEYFPKITNGFITIINNKSKNLNDGWEAELAIKNIPYLPHTINSLKELRRYYIDGIQAGYQARKEEESINYSEEEVKNLCIKYKIEHSNKFIEEFETWFKNNKKK